VTLFSQKYLQTAIFVISERVLSRALSCDGLRGKWQDAYSRAAGFGLIEARFVRPLAQTGGGHSKLELLPPRGSS